MLRCGNHLNLKKYYVNNMNGNSNNRINKIYKIFCNSGNHGNKIGLEYNKIGKFKRLIHKRYKCNPISK